VISLSSQELKCKVSFSLDAWTSTTGYGFLAIVMHYVSNDWELGRSLSMSSTCFLLPATEELLVDFKEIHGEHSGENLAKLVWETMQMYGLEDKVRYTWAYLFRGIA
jgi:hypothetical protein